MVVLASNFGDDQMLTRNLAYIPEWVVTRYSSYISYPVSNKYNAMHHA